MPDVDCLTFSLRRDAGNGCGVTPGRHYRWFYGNLTNAEELAEQLFRNDLRHINTSSKVSAKCGRHIRVPAKHPKPGQSVSTVAQTV